MRERLHSRGAWTSLHAGRFEVACGGVPAAEVDGSPGGCGSQERREQVLERGYSELTGRCVLRRQNGLRPAARPTTTGALTGAGGNEEDKEQTKPNAGKRKENTA